ncbi:hypothetical protein CLIB1444_02S07294 [[Candida] jaroonii]|uniref:Uncharacterized protein n=1 Tax=[Candida] jaroonii TaxID=467808 RepID=A0ACA9Y3K1_9ASCO|nr:hypothetical protein CLIB1444_02S07294 [[Candida] jaroonii]
MFRDVEKEQFKIEAAQSISKSEAIRLSNSKFRKMVDSVSKQVLTLNQWFEKNGFVHPYMEVINPFFYDKVYEMESIDKSLIISLEKQFKDIVSKVGQLQTQLRRDQFALVHKIQPHLKG